MKNDFSSLLNSSTQASLKRNLQLSDATDSTLRRCSREIQRAIVEGVRYIRALSDNNNGHFDVSTPKFFIQGSYAYNTMIEPEFPPAQKVDIDLGVYLPPSQFEANFMSSSHSESDIKTTLDAVRTAFKRLSSS